MQNQLLAAPAVRTRNTLMNHPVRIEPLEPQHAPAVAKIHSVSQSGTFLTSLGEEFLTLLYRRISRSACGNSYVALSGEDVVGFIVGALSTKQLFKDVALKAPLHFGWLVFKRGLSRPTLLAQAFKTLAYPSQGDENLPDAELLALAVDTPWRNQKIGAQLVTQLRQSMHTAGIGAMVVTVDGDNAGALRFYQRHGFKPAAVSHMYGRPMQHLVLTFQE